MLNYTLRIADKRHTSLTGRGLLVVSLKKSDQWHPRLLQVAWELSPHRGFFPVSGRSLAGDDPGGIGPKRASPLFGPRDWLRHLADGFRGPGHFFEQG